MKIIYQLVILTTLIAILVAPLARAQILVASVRDLALYSAINTTATCGTSRPERYCLLDRPDTCSTCDNRPDASNEFRHPIQYAIDGTERWWQSPTLTNGFDYNNVVITMDLKQAFRITYVILVSANSPAPARWVLERSLDGRNFTAWQYYAQTGSECVNEFNTESNEGGSLSSDSQVICVTTGITANQFQNAEVIARLLSGRPGARVSGYTQELRNFLSARYIRLRLLQVRTMRGDLQSPEDQDASVTDRYFYSIKGITVGGECTCNGHASRCEYNSGTDSYRCLCERNTCGDKCDRCCDSYIQKLWKAPTVGSPNACEPCQCFNHTNQCRYNQTIADRNQSLDINGNYQGGGICLNCQHYTEGINCERCIHLYYRPIGVSRGALDACQSCRCNVAGIRDVSGRPLGSCIKDTEEARQYPQMNPGDCFCKQNVTGSKCDRCAVGFDGFPVCRPCRCNPFGSVNSSCQSTNCQCRINVEGSGCRQCKSGTYGLDNNDPAGCTKCFCFNLTSTCSSSNLIKQQISTLNGWRVYDVRSQNSFLPVTEQNRNNYNLTSGADTLHWQAPSDYTGNWLTSYGEIFKYTILYNTVLTVTREFRPETVIVGNNGIRLRHHALPLRFDNQGEVQTRLLETEWTHNSTGNPVTREQFMMTLNHVTQVFIRLSFITSQRNSYISNAILTRGVEGTYSLDGTVKVEKCECPAGYAGLSCERCAAGYRRENGQPNGRCIPCKCNNHSNTCNDITGICSNCQDNTEGSDCGQCRSGYYGNATHGTPNDCKPCACPSTIASNNFSPSCELAANGVDLICTNCTMGYTGQTCQSCSDGYQGNPNKIGHTCQPCNCSGNIDLSAQGNCNTTTGVCLKCTGNTAGDQCQLCADGYYGDAINLKNCRACGCNTFGSSSQICERRRGECSCKPFVTGRTCDQCRVGYYGLDSNEGCKRCDCHPLGSVSPLSTCDAGSGQCPCKSGIGGRDCSRCARGYWNFTKDGCTPCNCSRTGGACDASTGNCICPPNVEGKFCDTCAPHAYGYDPVQGCKLCDCSPFGSESLQCNYTNGQCSCKENYDGRQCNQCGFGLYGYPDCKTCQCNQLGALSSSCRVNTGGNNTCDCHDTTGKCQCKANVEGLHCNQCKPSSYYFNSSPVVGCTSCYCSGFASTCTSSNYNWTTKAWTFSDDWLITDNQNIIPTAAGISFVRGINEISVIHREVDPRLQGLIYYWAVPFSLLGNKVTSYGGLLQFDIEFDSLNSAIMSTDRDIIFMGGYDHKVIHKAHPTPLNHIQTTVTVALNEDGWIDSSTYQQITKSEFMAVLARLDVVLIRAHFGNNQTRVTLSNITVQVAQPNDTGGPAAPIVEICNCPIGYSGTSCERCATGYKRVLNGTCIPCQCNGHSNLCHPETGLCQNCQHNTDGRFCDQCGAGFYGDATQGNINDCTPCACPLSTSSNNFSPTCQLDGMGSYTCLNCSGEYLGKYCERCADGYYGKPGVAGDTCKPCDCNDNIDITQSGNCNRTTGRCLKCTRNTAGDRCQDCADGYFGDAVVAKNCRKCSCNRVGSTSDQCSNSGRCTCKPNYTGDKCDRCVTNTFMYFGQCIDCLCDVDGSVTSSCNASGNCLCRANYTGSRCDNCLPGHYFINGECQACNCSVNGTVDNGALCDNVGRCYCKDGNIGDKCDQCQSMHYNQLGNCINCESQCLMPLIQKLNASRLQELSNEVINAPDNILNRLELRINQSEIELIRYRNMLANASSILGINNTGQSINLDTMSRSLDGLSLQEMRRANDIKNFATLVQSDIEDVANRSEMVHNYAIAVTARVNGLIEEMVSITQHALWYNSTNWNDTYLLQEARRLFYLVENALGETVVLTSNVSTDSAALLRDARNVDASYQQQNKIVTDLKPVFDQIRSKVLESVTIARNVTTLVTAINTINNQNDIDVRRAEALYQQVTDIRLMIQNSMNATDIAIVRARTMLMDSFFIYQAVLANMQRLDYNLVVVDRLYNSTLSPMNRTEQLFIRAQKYAADIRNVSNLINKLFEDAETTRSVFVNGSVTIPLLVAEARELNKNVTELTIKINQMRREIDVAVIESQQIQQNATSLQSIINATDIPGKLIQLQSDLARLNTLATVLENNRVALDQFTIDAEIENSAIQSRLEQARSVQQRSHRLLLEMQQEFDNLSPLIKADLRSTDGIKDDILSESNVVSNISLTDSVLEDTENTSNSVQDNLNKMQDFQNRLLANISSIRLRLQYAQKQSARLRLSLESINGNCHRQYKAPSTFATSNSIYATVRINQSNGVIVYVPGYMADRFLSIEVINSRIVGKINLGVGITTLNHPTTVSLNRWYTIIMKRDGNKAYLSLITNHTLDTRSEVNATVSYRDSYVFHDSGDIYAPGIPDSVSLPTGIQQRQFTGCIGELRYNNRFLALWTYKNTTGQCQIYSGSYRPYFRLSKQASTYHFDGDGYIYSYVGDSFVPSDFISEFAIRTFEPNALLFYLPRYNNRSSQALADDSYLAIEIKQGHIIGTVKIGNFQSRVQSTAMYNTGKYYSIRLVFYASAGNNPEFRIDITDSGLSRNVETMSAENFSGFPSSIGTWTGTIFYLGGIQITDAIPQGISRTGYIGCIANATFRGQSIVIRARYNILSGCPNVAISANQVSLNGSGFVVYPNISEASKIDFAFRTNGSDQVIMVGSNGNEMRGFTFILLNGRLNAEFKFDGSQVSVSLHQQLNDSVWHFVRVVKNDRRFSITIDKQTPLSTGELGVNAATESFSFARTGHFYVGGIPTNFNQPIATRNGFSGCIKSIVLVDQIQELRNIISNNGEVLYGGCLPSSI